MAFAGEQQLGTLTADGDDRKSDRRKGHWRSRPGSGFGTWCRGHIKPDTAVYHGRYYTNGELWDGRSERSNSKREHHVVTCGVPVYADIKRDWHAKHHFVFHSPPVPPNPNPKKATIFLLSLFPNTHALASDFPRSPILDAVKGRRRGNKKRHQRASRCIKTPRDLTLLLSGLVWSGLVVQPIQFPPHATGLSDPSPSNCVTSRIAPSLEKRIISIDPICCVWPPHPDYYSAPRRMSAGGDRLRHRYNATTATTATTTSTLLHACLPATHQLPLRMQEAGAALTSRFTLSPLGPLHR